MRLTYRILMLGDFYFGETYSRGKVIERVGYQRSLHNLHAFVDRADYTAANFEGPIRDGKGAGSPINSKRRYLHSADIVYTGKVLRALGVDAVSLANNHSMDYGQRGIVSTFRALEDSGIRWFGAGYDSEGALAHHIVPMPHKFGSGSIRLAGMYQYLKGMAADGVYASKDSPGLAPLDPRSIERHRIHDPLRDFAIAFPHWGKNYLPVTDQQLIMARALASVGFRTIIGHGSHALQHASHIEEVPTFFGIGNGVFNSPGRYSKLPSKDDCIPYSLWTMLTVTVSESRRNVSVKLYPVRSDNNVTDYCPAPVSEQEFNTVSNFLDTTTDKVSPMNLRAGQDDLGFYLEKDLGDWKIEEAPLHPADRSANKEVIDTDVVDSLTPNTYTDERSVEMLEQVQELGRMNGTVILADAAARDGAEVQWIAEGLAIATFEGDRRLLSSHRGTESPVGATIVKDKLLAKQFLQKSDVATPRGRLVNSAQDAIEFMKEVNTPVVLKPRFGNTGKGVSVNLADPAIIAEAFELAERYGDVLVEETIDKVSEYRCLASANECHSVTERLLPSVVGDGISTIETLIINKNKERQNSLSTLNRPTPLDEAVERTLRKQGYTIDTVLEKGRRVTVRDVGGLSSGGEPFERTASVNDSVKNLAKAAIAAIPGLNWAGSDIIVTPDGSPYIIEINTSADISGASFPLYGDPVPVGSVLWKKIKSHPRRRSRSVTVIKGLEERSADPQRWLHSGRRMRLGSLFVEALKAKGISVEEFSKTLRKVSFGGEELWFRNVSSNFDLGSSTTMIARHLHVRKFLEFNGFQLPQAYYRVNGRRFRELQPTLQGQWACVRGRRPWPGRDQSIAVSASELTIESLRTKAQNVLQYVPDGGLFRALASPDGCLFVLSPNQEAREHVAAVERLAVEVARSIPNLTLVGIDLVLATGADGDSQILIEGLSVNPIIDPAWELMSGSLEAVWEQMIGGPLAS